MVPQRDPSKEWIAMSTCNDLSLSSSWKRLLHRAIYGDRKSYKTQSRGEVVWSPDLEMILLEALIKYRPSGKTRTPKAGGRNPLRNKIISDYIFKATQKRRTAKQVSSRLQQLKATTPEPELLEVLLTPGYRPEKNALGCPRIFSLVTEEEKGVLEEVLGRHLEIFEPRVPPSDVRLFPPSDSRDSSSSAPSSSSLIGWPQRPPSSHPVRLSAPACVYINVARTDGHSHYSWDATGISTTGYSAHPGHSLSGVDPTVTFVSPSPLNVYNHRCHAEVFRGEAVVHAEMTDLQPSDDAVTASAYGYGISLYNTQLVPRYWHYLCNQPNITDFVILQTVVQMETRTISHQAPMPPPFQVALAVEYHFRYVDPSSDSHVAREVYPWPLPPTLGNNDADRPSDGSHPSWTTEGVDKADVYSPTALSLVPKSKEGLQYLEDVQLSRYDPFTYNTLGADITGHY